MDDQSEGLNIFSKLHKSSFQKILQTITFFSIFQSFEFDKKLFLAKIMDKLIFENKKFVGHVKINTNSKCACDKIEQNQDDYINKNFISWTFFF